MFGNTASIRLHSSQSVWWSLSVHLHGDQTHHGLWGLSKEIGDLFWLVREWELSTFPYQSKVRGGWSWEAHTDLCSWLQYSAIDPGIHRIIKKKKLKKDTFVWVQQRVSCSLYLFALPAQSQLQVCSYFSKLLPQLTAGVWAHVWCFQGRWPRVRAECVWFTAQCLPAGNVPPAFQVAQTYSQ